MRRVVGAIHGGTSPFPIDFRDTGHMSATVSEHHRMLQRFFN
jgi:hypothetical protein